MEAAGNRAGRVQALTVKYVLAKKLDIDDSELDFSPEDLARLEQFIRDKWNELKVFVAALPSL